MNRGSPAQPPRSPPQASDGAHRTLTTTHPNKRGGGGSYDGRKTREAFRFVCGLVPFDSKYLRAGFQYGWVRDESTHPVGDFW